MNISSQIKIGASVAGNAKGILADLMKDTPVRKGLWYAVTTTPGKAGLLYILSSIELGHRWYHEQGLTVLGIAGSWPEAAEIVRLLIEEGYQAGSIFSMKTFLQEMPPEAGFDHRPGKEADRRTEASC